MNRYSVSVLIPVHNRLSYLREAVQSALAQTVPVQILIYDDASGVEVKNWLVCQHDERVQWCRGAIHKGPGYARNELLAMADTPYACWLDSDDLMAPDRVEKQLAFLQHEKADIVWTDMLVFHSVRWDKHLFTIASGRKLRGPDLNKWKTGTPGMFKNCTNGSGMFTKSVYKFCFAEDIWKGEDSVWAYTIFKSGCKCAVLHEALYFYRQHGQQLTRHIPISIRTNNEAINRALNG